MRWKIELAEDREGRGYRFVIESRSTWMEDTEGRSQSPSLFSVQRGMVKSAFTVRAALRFDCSTYRYSTSAVPVYYSPRPMATVIYTAFMICYPVFDVCCYDQRTSGLSSFSSFLFSTSLSHLFISCSKSFARGIIIFSNEWPVLCDKFRDRR